jgi:hypothetical protein
MPLFAWALVLLVASYAITSLTMKRPQSPGPTAIEEIDFPQSDEGTPHAVFFGDNWTKGFQVLWYGNMRTVKVSSKKKPRNRLTVVGTS